VAHLRRQDQLPWRPTGRRSRSTGRSASSIGDPRRPTSCCRGGDGLRERYCSQKDGPQLSCCQSTVRLGGHVQSGTRRVKIRGIIPFVNKTLTSGLPIGSAGKRLMISL
jgi:hypothetical protein